VEPRYPLDTQDLALVNGITIAEQDAYLDYCVSDFCSILRLQIAHVRTSCPLGTLISIFCRDRDCDCDVSQAATFRPHCRNKQILPNLLLKFVGPQLKAVSVCLCVLDQAQAR
jgi:hypothetical protein